MLFFEAMGRKPHMRNPNAERIPNGAAFLMLFGESRTRASRSEGGARKREGSLEAKRRAYSKKCEAFLQKQRLGADCEWLTKITLRYQMLAMATY